MMNSKFPREIFFEDSDKGKFDFTVFLGIYNGSQYLASLKSQLLSQTNQSFQIVVVDNNSTDNSYELIKEWSKCFESRITIARNKINVGGSGTILNSLDLIKSNWFTAFHQDDYYKPEHVEVLLTEIEKSPKSVVAVSTTMASMEADGTKLGTVPRSSMFAKSNQPVSAFLNNLKIHSVPWPATAFKCEVFKQSAALWHSTAFPDTEQILRMCAYGEFVTVDQETMYYRENPLSESHAVISNQSEIGVALSLLRVFGSPEFTAITTQLSENEVELFGLELIGAIDFRLRQSALAGFLSLYAVEMLIQRIGYRNRGLTLLAQSLYQELQIESTASLLLNIAQMNDTKSEEIQINQFLSIQNFTNYFNSKKLIATQKENSFTRFIRNKNFQKLPFRWKKTIIRILVNFANLFGKFEQFRFDWR